MNKVNCPTCGPQKMWGEINSSTHVLCLNCGEEIEIKKVPPGRWLTRKQVEEVLYQQATYDFNPLEVLDELFGKEE